MNNSNVTRLEKVRIRLDTAVRIGVSFNFWSLKGMCEHGIPCKLTEEEQNSTRQNELYRANGYNALLSEKISMKRAVPDLRHFA